MDTSKEYILMCDKALEIQLKILKYQNDDGIVYCSHCDKTYDFGFDNFMWQEEFGNGEKCQQFTSSYYTSDFPIYHGKKAIWLPRQDQLQDMIKNSYSNLIEPLIALLSFFEFFKYPTTLSSFEQLWLAYIMYENYGKIFNGSDWIKNG